MRRRAALLFQAVIVLIGIGTLALILWEPQLEGRNAHATFFEIYFNDPFLAYAYFASINFFVALYQAFKLMGYLGRNELLSQRSVKALRTIKYCSLALVAFIMGAEAYLFIVQRGKDDIAGGVAVSLFLLLIAVGMATAAAVFERRLRLAVDKKPHPSAVETNGSKRRKIR